MRKVIKGLKHAFIPHEGNDKQPHILRPKATKRLMAVTVVLEILVLVALFPIFSKTLDFIAAVLPGVLADEANRSRAELNLNTLQTNPLLVQAAQLKADDMAARGYFSHNTPEGEEPWIFLNRAGYAYESAGENLAVNFSDSLATHEAWMNSPGHRANIVRGTFTEIGIATARGKYQGQNTIFVVQFFGKPSRVAVAPTPTPVVPTPTPAPAVVVSESVPTPVPVVESPVIVLPETTTPEPEEIDVPVQNLNEIFNETEPTNAEPLDIVPERILSEVESVETKSLLQSILDTLGRSIVAMIDILSDITIAISGGNDVAQNEVPAEATVQSAETDETFTTTEGADNTPGTSTGEFVPKASILSYLVSSPRTFSSIAFGILTLIIVIALILKIFIHIKTQYVKLILNGVLILVVILAFLLINHEVSLYLGTVL